LKEVMKGRILLLISFLPVLAFAQVYKKHSVQKDRISIQLDEGMLYIIPLSDKAIRICFCK